MAWAFLGGFPLLNYSTCWGQVRLVSFSDGQHPKTKQYFEHAQKYIVGCWFKKSVISLTCCWAGVDSLQTIGIWQVFWKVVNKNNGKDVSSSQPRCYKTRRNTIK